MRGEFVTDLAKLMADSEGVEHPDPNAHRAAALVVLAYPKALVQHRSGSPSAVV
jgi:hypothetical protein